MNAALAEGPPASSPWGTTVTRTLEDQMWRSATAPRGLRNRPLHHARLQFKAVTGLLNNFHLPAPRSSCSVPPVRPASAS